MIYLQDEHNKYTYMTKSHPLHLMWDMGFIKAIKGFIFYCPTCKKAFKRCAMIYKVQKYYCLKCNLEMRIEDYPERKTGIWEDTL